MSDITEKLTKRVHEIMPELVVESVHHNTEGAINDVLIVNDAYIFRFAKTEEYARRLYAELKIMDLVRPLLNIGIPTPIHSNYNCIVYPMLKGDALPRHIVLGFDEAKQTRIAQQMGEFLLTLHSIDITDQREIPATRAPVKRDNWVKLHARVKDKIYPLLQGYQIDYVESLMAGALQNPEFFKYETALIHGDLAPYHFIYDPDAARITGVIDFGMSGIGDPASDIGGLISIYGETFVKRMKPVYPNLESLLPRARFYAQGLELEWTLLGLESGHNFWFTAHLAGARDIHS
jgi:aminoglycoside 2''-phosphotransferase